MAKIAKRRGRWVIDFYDTSRKRRLITMPKGSKKKDANDKLHEIEDQLAKGIWIPDKRIPIFKEVAKDWLEYKKPNIRHNTWEKYDGYVRNHYDDVSTPYYGVKIGKQDAMDCTDDGSDGFADLTLKFDRQQFVEALRSAGMPLDDNVVIAVPLTGNLLVDYDQIPINLSDIAQ